MHKQPQVSKAFQGIFSLSKYYLYNQLLCDVADGLRIRRELVV